MEEGSVISVRAGVLTAPRVWSSPGRTILDFLRQHYLSLFIAGLLLWVVGAPILTLLSLSFHAGTPANPGDLTLGNYQAMLSSRFLLPTLLNTIAYAGIVSLVSLTIAATFAWLVERTDMPGRNLAWMLMLLPIAMPGMLSSMGWTLLLSSRNGLINLAIRGLLDMVGIHLAEGPFDIFSLGGMIWVESLRGTTTVFLLLVAAFRLMDPALEEASITAGAGVLQTFWRVTMRLMMPALLAAGMYAFLGNLEDFDVPLLLGLPGGVFVLPTLIYFTAYASPSPNWGLAASYTAIFLLIAVLLVVVYHRLILRRAGQFATITGKGFRPRRIGLGRMRYAAMALFGIFFVLTIGLPLLVLFYASLLPIYQVPSPEVLARASFDNYAELLKNPILAKATVNTTLLALGTATMTMALAFSVSWLVVRQRVKGGVFLDAISFIPHAIPSVVVGLALIVFYLHPALRWTAIYGSLTLMSLAMMTRYLAFGTRSSNSAMTQVSAELEEASWLSGAGKLRTLLTITTPLLMPAFIAGWVWVAAQTFRSLTIPLLLVTPGNQTISIALYDFWEKRANYPLAAALGVVLILTLALMIFLSRSLISRGYTRD